MARIIKTTPSVFRPFDLRIEERADLEALLAMLGMGQDRLYRQQLEHNINSVARSGVQYNGQFINTADDLQVAGGRIYDLLDKELKTYGKAEEAV